MRLGATSYIYPADIITNARRLAGSIDDIELVIFEVEHEANLPDPETIEELVRIGADHNMTYTVHLPTDIGMADREPCVEKAIRVIRRTEGLSPHAFIVHLDGNPPNHRLDPAAWLENSLSSLEILWAEISEPEMLSVENLENHNPEMIDSILEKIKVSCFVDVGHLLETGPRSASASDQMDAQGTGGTYSRGGNRRSRATVPCAQRQARSCSKISARRP